MQFIFTIIISTLSSVVYAHPVSFQDSIGVMGEQTQSLSHTQINYSARYWVAVGVHHFQRTQTSDQRATAATVNLLLKRWNGNAFQANLYGIVGGGYSTFSNESGGRVLTGAQVDIEDRRFYFLAKQLDLFDGARADLRSQNLRIGFAPYVGAFTDIHSWLILDWMKMNFIDGSQYEDVTPMLRFFYKNLLFEVGQSFSGMTRFNYIIHF